MMAEASYGESSAPVGGGRTGPAKVPWLQFAIGVLLTGSGLYFLILGVHKYDLSVGETSFPIELATAKALIALGAGLAALGLAVMGWAGIVWRHRHSSWEEARRRRSMTSNP